LGVLAGDIVREAGSEGRDFVALGPAYRHNVAVKTDQTTPIDKQLMANSFELVTGKNGKPIVTTVDFHTWQVKVRAWQRYYGSARLLLLDTDFEPNTPINRNLTANLYDPDVRTRMLQQYLLAAAGITMLRELGLEPAAYHLNEGHMAFVLVVLAMEYGRDHKGVTFQEALEAISGKVVATKHTILSGAGDFADRATIVELFDASLNTCGFSGNDLFEAGTMARDEDVFSTTKLLLTYAHRANGVSRMHVKAEHKVHPSSKLIPITNGIYVPGWQRPNLFKGVAAMSDKDLWEAHNANRAQLIDFINKTFGTKLDPERLTMVWARRFAAYKRPTLVFTNPDRLAAILGNPDRPIQLLISGNANETDTEGVKALEAIASAIQREAFSEHLVYLPHYVTGTTKQLAGAADLWLNTPIRGMEACGTSGMKAGLNGALQFSTSDGWFDEVDSESVGWVLPEENSATVMYDTLEHQIAPMFYERTNGVPTAWVKRMRAMISMIETEFCGKRMLDDYYKQLYGLSN
jgi:glycogen phosphorylase